MSVDPSRLNEFKKWLVERGAIIHPSKGEWETLRFETDMGTLVVYHNSKGDQTWSTSAAALFESFEKNRQVALTPDRARRRKLRHLAEEIAERDGLECWFCAYPFLSADSREATIEHLVSRAHGGPNHVSNLVLSCEPCNLEAGALPVSKKVELREKKRNLVAAKA